MRYKKAFTLIELLIIIVIIGVLATVAVAQYGEAKARNRDARRRADLKQISTAIEMYKINNGSYKIGTTGGKDSGGIDISWLNYSGPGAATYPYHKSIIQGLIEAGVLSSAQRDPLCDSDACGYIYKTDSAKYSLYATLERPSDTDLQTYPSDSAVCDQLARTGWQKNYRVGTGL
ncbi:MAG: prepilin-type N-terminal cleavage/methylation domain-containing protein [Patescibacteria group bacterium]|jgi:prepilin-type N-terminal cleavage/methylation domain-containing protein